MDELEVLIENIVFQSADSAFCVFRAKSKETGSVCVVYRGIAPFVGEVVKMKGKWGEHPKFGRQFQATIWQSVKPSTAVGIERFLGSGAIHGVGKAMAARIIERFGDAALEIISTDPYRLTEITGIGKKKAEDIINSYAALSDMRELMVFLEEHGISSNYAPKLQATYGATAITRIENNPYCLATDVVGIGFKTADKIALALGHDFNDSERIKAGINYALLQASSQGHTCVPDNTLLEVTAGLLQIDELEAAEVFNQLIKADLVRTETLGGVRLVYPEYLYRAETGVAHRLLALRDNVNKLWKVDYQTIVKNWEDQEHIELAEEQKEAVKASVEHGVFVLTGGPGTGKTTVVKGILSVLEKAGCKILLAAPTGRAARRLSESAGQSATTVHRLLEYTPAGDGQFWGRNEENPLEADAIIVDEASMLDIALMYYLLRAIPIGCRLILVGDVDQLPSVGPGSVLKDIIRSKSMPVVRLENVFRQAELSPIVRNAHRINRGLPPEFEVDSDFTFHEFEKEEEAAQFVVDLYAKLTGNGKWQDVQVLSPMHKNPCGVQNLNAMIQKRMNPPRPGKGEINTGGIILRVGDKIMQIRNNYEKDVFNGDIGCIKAINGRNIVAGFPDRTEGEDVTYAAGEIDDLQLAYAMSVHKAQGSEYGTVIMPFVRSHYMLLQRNLLYTGVTRAKDKVVLVGSYSALNIAVNNDKTRKRYSLLAERLQDIQNFN
ncbi:ATP-dependent RecD-like DNA helicase [bioreactor metagenome]|jgi:helicase, putative, RecD/TraA family|uniref:ATP-dependent RecD-like DNA helicase n=1 Tax=bioreactor metagenome TaxID=1076179 RepID=A0A644VZG4_9ZZZZ|nr:ATP-dependent RecD-like DNA helicase [Acidaminococcaceae bacterium]